MDCFSVLIPKTSENTHTVLILGWMPVFQLKVLSVHTSLIVLGITWNFRYKMFSSWDISFHENRYANRGVKCRYELQISELIILTPSTSVCTEASSISRKLWSPHTGKSFRWRNCFFWKIVFLIESRQNDKTAQWISTKVLPIFFFWKEKWSSGTLYSKIVRLSFDR